LDPRIDLTNTLKIRPPFRVIFPSPMLEKLRATG